MYGVIRIIIRNDNFDEIKEIFENMSNNNLTSLFEDDVYFPDNELVTMLIERERHMIQIEIIRYHDNMYYVEIRHNGLNFTYNEESVIDIYNLLPIVIEKME